MDTIHRLETILVRLKRCPLNLLRVELEMFQNTLKSDTHLISILTEIVTSNEQTLGSKASTLVNNISSSAWLDLSFANTASLRAAVGYQLCQCLLGETDSVKCGKNIHQIGNYYYSAYEGQGGSRPITNAIRTFSEIFLEPIISYLNSSLELRHRLLMLLGRYKQRSEWFSNEEQINTMLENRGNIEAQLKREFLLYLFDNGIDFSIESEVPSGGGEVDVLTVLPELGLLPIEVKVFDGNRRGSPYISGGLAQTAEYARKFNRPEAYYIVYNIAENIILSLPGIATEQNVVGIQLTPITIYAIVINLRMTIPASRAKNLTSIDILLPQ